jgi:hypothetical protein
MISSKGCSFKMFSASSCACYKSRSILAKVSVTLVTLPAKSLENPGSNLGFPGHWLGSWVLSDGANGLIFLDIFQTDASQIQWQMDSWPNIL